MSRPDHEKYPKATGMRSADRAHQMIGWKTFFISDGKPKNIIQNVSETIIEEKNKTSRTAWKDMLTLLKGTWT